MTLSAYQTGEAALRSSSLTYVAREFAQLIIRDMRRSMREETARREPRISSNYDLRVSEDKFLVRLRYRF